MKRRRDENGGAAASLVGVLLFIAGLLLIFGRLFYAIATAEPFAPSTTDFLFGAIGLASMVIGVVLMDT